MLELRKRKSVPERDGGSITKGTAHIIRRLRHASWKREICTAVALALVLGSFCLFCLICLWRARTGTIDTGDLDLDGWQQWARRTLPGLVLCVVAAVLVPVVLNEWPLNPLVNSARASIRCVSAIHAVRQPADASLLQAAAGVVPRGRLYLVLDDLPYAMCLGLWRPEIYVSTGLCARLTPSVLRAALAHEECHRRRRDPLRLLILQAAMRRLLPDAQMRAIQYRAELRGEIIADRFARASVSTADLAAALLVVLRARQQDPTSGARSGMLATAQPAGSMWLDGPSYADEVAALNVRLRYLSLPDTAPLPAGLAGAIRPRTAMCRLLRRLWWVGVPTALGATVCVSCLICFASVLLHGQPVSTALGCVR